MTVETTRELDGLYSSYFSLIREEVECTDKLLATRDIKERNAFIEKAMEYSREASAIAKAIKEIEDSGEIKIDPGDKTVACRANPGT